MLHAFIQFLIQIVGSLQFLLIVNSNIPSMSEEKGQMTLFFSESCQQMMCKAVQVTKNLMAAKVSLHKGHVGDGDIWSLPSFAFA